MIGAAFTRADDIATDTAVSDMDYLRSKMQTAPEEEQAEDLATPIKQESSKSKKRTTADELDAMATARAQQITAQDQLDKLLRPSAFDSGVHDGKLTVRLRGLPFRATEPDVRGFFAPLVAVAVRFVIDKEDRPSGFAFVEFGTEKDVKKALKKTNEKMESRYIEVMRDEGDQKPVAKKGIRGTKQGGGGTVEELFKTIVDPFNILFQQA